MNGEEIAMENGDHLANFRENLGPIIDIPFYLVLLVVKS